MLLVQKKKKNEVFVALAKVEQLCLKGWDFFLKANRSTATFLVPRASAEVPLRSGSPSP